MAHASPVPLLTCAICGNAVASPSVTRARVLRPSLRAILDRGREGRLADADDVCRRCVFRGRSDELLELLSAERGSLTAIEKEVAEKAARHEIIANDLEAELVGRATRGQRLADGVARVGGSWTFVVGFLGVLGIWMAVNAFALRGHAFDPYPFILLNLVLSCVAALQAPIIMMSQNRASLRDRMQANQDFRVNLKAELEVAGLHEKVDHLLHQQWESLLTVQQAQLDLLSEIADQVGTPPPRSTHEET